MNYKIVLGVLAAAVLIIGVAVWQGVKEVETWALVTLVAAGFVGGLAPGLLIGANNPGLVDKWKGEVENKYNKIR